MHALDAYQTSDPRMFMRLDDSASSRALRASVHGLVTSALTISDRDAREGPNVDNAWKWGLITNNLTVGDNDIFGNFPYQELWNSQKIGMIQALQYVADLRVQALEHMLAQHLWDNTAEAELYLIRNLEWLARARSRMDLYWDFEHAKTQTPIYSKAS